VEEVPRGRSWLSVVVLCAIFAVAGGTFWYVRSHPVVSAAVDVAPTHKPKSAHRRTAPEGSTRAALHRPKPKPCKSLPEGDDGFVASQGLDEVQIRNAMNAFLPNALACLPEGWTTSGTIGTHITVGCNGVVSSVEVTDAGGFPADVVACVRDTIGYAPFPAHDQTEGMVFDYPVRIDF
jgi:hypothetical protein